MFKQPATGRKNFYNTLYITFKRAYILYFRRLHL